MSDRKKNYVFSPISIWRGFPFVGVGFVTFLMYYFGAGVFWWGVYAVLLAFVLITMILMKRDEVNVGKLFDENGKIRKDLLP